MIWMFFLACVTKKVDSATEQDQSPDTASDTAEVVDPNIALCEQAREGFYEYKRELNETVVDRTCETHDDCMESSCHVMCGTTCAKILANTDTYDLVWELLEAYEAEHCQACENYPYPEPEAPPVEPVSEPPWCTEGICE